MKPKYLLIPERRWKDIRALITLSVDQMRAVAETLGSKETLRSHEVSYQRIARNASITHEEAISVLSAIANLTLQRKRYSLTDEQLLYDLGAGEPEGFKKLDEQGKSALLNLLTESEEGYFVEKAESLRISLIPHMVSVRSICDIRPVFDRERRNIEGALIVTFLDITTHDEEHKNNSLFFQITRDDLRKLKECIDETERKMDIMEKKFRSDDLDLFF